MCSPWQMEPYVNRLPCATHSESYQVSIINLTSGTKQWRLCALRCIFLPATRCVQRSAAVASRSTVTSHRYSGDVINLSSVNYFEHLGNPDACRELKTVSLYTSPAASLAALTNLALSWTVVVEGGGVVATSRKARIARQTGYRDV